MQLLTRTVCDTNRNCHHLIYWIRSFVLQLMVREQLIHDGWLFGLQVERLYRKDTPKQRFVRRLLVKT